MDRIRQSFRRKRNKHKQSENTFDVQNVFESVEGEEDSKPPSRIDKIRKSIRTLKRKKKKNAKDSDDREPVDEELDGNNDDKLNFYTNDEDTIDERIDDFPDEKPPSRDWRMLPDLIFSDVMMKIVLESFESLHRCRQVCKNWNEKIMSNIWESPSKREIIKTRIEKTWETGKISDDEISHARWLGRYKFIA